MSFLYGEIITNNKVVEKRKTKTDNKIRWKKEKEREKRVVKKI